MNVQAVTALIVAITSLLGTGLAIYHAVTAKQAVRQQQQGQAANSAGGPPSSGASRP